MNRPIFLYSDRVLTFKTDSGYLIELRRVLQHLGIEPNDVSIGHPGERFMLLGMQFFHTIDPRAAVDQFLDDEIGIPHVSYPRRTSTIHSQVSQGRDPGDECPHFRDQ